MKLRVWLAILSGALLGSAASAQTSSHFDVAGNVSFGGTQVAGTPSSGVQMNAVGWQTSGITHFNRWLSMTSEFSGGSASANSISLIGYTGPGTIKHYSVLAGPRINIPLRGRVTPFVQGFAGYDRASTSLTSGTTLVNGNETQLAYAFGGGTQIGVTRRIGLNVEANYFASEHTLAYTGWQPSHFQLSAGIVIKLFGVRTTAIAKEQPLSSPTAPSTTESASTVAPPPATAQPAAPVTEVASVQPIPTTSTLRPEIKTQTATEPTKAADVPQQAFTASPTAPTPAPAPVKVDSQITAAVIVTPAPAQAGPVRPAVVQPAPAQPTPAQVAQRQTPVAPPALAPAPAAPAQIAQVQPDQSQPVSLGEYARRLREKKQHSGSTSSSSW